MVTIIDKRLRAALFRERLTEAMSQARVAQSELARRTGVDRSTISQLLKDSGARLPNAHVVGACATALGVSADWLLGLTARPENAADLMSNAMSLRAAPRALVDEAIFGWHKEAQGYKIRHVPAALPDMLKTREVLEWEYAPHLGRTAQQAINAATDRLTWMQGSSSDYEICIPLYELDCFATATGYYTGLCPHLRRRQLTHMIDLTERLYPRLRLNAFDARRLYSAPITLFGPLLAVIYLGHYYLVFRDSDRVEAFTGHFDHLVREADVTSRDMPEHLTQLHDAIGV